MATALDPKLYTFSDEPLEAGRPVDYRYLYDLAHEEFTRDEDRARHLDAKLAALFTGVIAAIGFSFRVNPNTVGAATALLYIVPLAIIASAYTTRQREFVPKVAELEAWFPTFPVSTLVESVSAMRIASEANASAYSKKSAYLDYAVAATVFVTIVALVAQLLVVLKVLRLAP